MGRLRSCVILFLVMTAVVRHVDAQTSSAQPTAKPAASGRTGSALSAAANSGPRDAKAGKLFAKAAKEFDGHKYALALGDFRQADTLDGGHCVVCEMQAYQSAKLMQEFLAAREEAALLLAHVTDADDKALAHALVGDACLSQGGYHMSEKPFQDADGEFQAGLELRPQSGSCLYGDGVALAHLHAYDKARERFEEFMKVAAPGDVLYARARLFAAQPELARTRVAPTFDVVALDGKPISMESFVGKVVLIDFWATWCGPCMQALPHLKEIAHEFEGQPLVVVSISLDQDEATWKNFVTHNGMTWLQYRDGGFDGPIASAFNVKAIPTTFSIDVNGFVQDQQVGDGNIETKVKELLAKAKDAANGKTLAAK